MARLTEVPCVIGFEGPPGVGKTVAFMDFLGRHRQMRPVSRVITRKRRSDENGRSNRFVSRAEFARLRAKGQLIGVHSPYGADLYGVRNSDIYRPFHHDHLTVVGDIGGQFWLPIVAEYGARACILVRLMAEEETRAERIARRSYAIQDFYRRMGAWEPAAVAADIVVWTDNKTVPEVVDEIELKLKGGAAERGFAIAGLHLPKKAKQPTHRGARRK